MNPKNLKYYTTLVCLLVSVLTIGVQAQNVGINTTGTAALTSAILDLNTGNTFTPSGGGNGKGLLIPNVPLLFPLPMQPLFPALHTAS